jgi:hypothetical protein
MKKRELVDELLRLARRAGGWRVEEEKAVVPPGFASGVVARWKSRSAGDMGESWLVVSRRGLAVALGVMLVSMLWHVRELRAPVSMESSASETVMLSLYPQ